MPILKSSACVGCPFYDKGEHYVPDKIVPGSTVMLIAQNPGQSEIDGHRLIKRHWLSGSKSHDEITLVKPQPLIGATGKKLVEEFLPLSGLDINKISLGNAIRCRPGKALGLAADELPTITTKMHLDESKSAIGRAIRHCAHVHLHIPDSVKTIVAMGSTALYQLTGQSRGTDWRGYVIRTSRDDIYHHRRADCNSYHDVKQQLKPDEIDIFSTIHIAALNKPTNKILHHATLRDFHKIKRFLRGEWPLALPIWSTLPPKQWPAYSSFDTEYNPENKELIRWSLYDTDNNLYCVEHSAQHPRHIDIAVGSTVLIQNALADMGYLANIVDMRKVQIEDLMLAHATLYTGEPHGLNYINSIFGAFNRYKHLIDTPGEEQLYSALDAYEPMHAWRYGIMPEFKKDPASYKVYKRFMLPLIPIIDQAQQKGVKLFGDRLLEVQALYRARLDAMSAEAQELTGSSHLNLGGLKEMKELIYEGI